jgi:hypothetical protein
MPRTRSTKATSKGPQETVPSDTQIRSLPSSEVNPAKLFILPSGVSQDARIVTLPDPARSELNRYFVCPKNGIHEFTKVATPRADPRSWLLSSDALDADLELEEKEKECSSSNRQVYISRSQDLFVATPVDALFFLLPVLSQEKTASKESRKSMFLTFEDHVDTADSVSAQLKTLLQNRTFKTIFESRLHSICDVVDAGEDSMYRISHPKLAKTLFEKARCVVEKGLPPSLENQFVSRALQTPIVSIKREDSALTESMSIIAQDSPDARPSDDSQSTAHTTSTTEHSVVTSATSTFSVTDMSTNDDSKNTTSIEMRHLLKLRIALEFILKSYTPIHLHELVRTEVLSANLVNFTPLDEHLKHLEGLRAEAQVLRAISDNINQKRARADDDEAAEVRA